MLNNKYLIYIFIAPFLFLSCTDSSIVNEFHDKEIENDKIVLTPEEFASIAYDNPQELTPEEISSILVNFQNNIEVGEEFATRSSKPAKIFIRKKYYITERNNIIEDITNTRSTTSAELIVPIFEVELSTNEGGKSLAVICGDERVPEVLFYVSNSTPHSKIDMEARYLLELSKKNVVLDIQQVEYMKLTRRDSTLKKIAQQLNISPKKISYRDIKDKIITTDEISTRNNNPGNQSNGQSRPQSNVVGFVNSLSKVSWNQNEPYNYGMRIMTIYDGYRSEVEGHLAVGCANVAIGILFSIIKPYMTLADNQRVDWDYATSVQSIRFTEGYPEYSSPQDLINMISGLLAQIATATESVPYKEEKELMDVNTGKTYKKSVITQTTTPTINTINYLRGMVNFSGNENYKFNGDQAKQSLFERKPVFLCGSGHIIDNNGNIIRQGGGHAWLIDGVIITKRPRQNTSEHYWSVNMGWGGWSRSYFRTSENLQNCDVVFRTENTGENIAYYTQEMTMLYNITRK